MPARWWLASPPRMWFTHVVKSRTIVDRGDGASVGAGDGGACACTGADRKTNREKLAVLNTPSFIIIAPPKDAATDTKLLGTRAILRHIPGQTAVRVFNEVPGRRPAAKLLSKD